jgi:hypothetical protein
MLLRIVLETWNNFTTINTPHGLPNAHVNIVVDKM